MHWLYAGTNGTRNGVAPAGRTWQQAKRVSMLFRFNRPPEATPVAPESEAFWSTPSRIAFFTPATGASGTLANASAAAPATCGLAIEVPEANCHPVLPMG